MGYYTAEESCPSATCQTTQMEQQRAHETQGKPRLCTARRTARGRGGWRERGLPFMRNKPDLNRGAVPPVRSDLPSPRTAVLVPRNQLYTQCLIF